MGMMCVSYVFYIIGDNHINAVVSQTACTSLDRQLQLSRSVLSIWLLYLAHMFDERFTIYSPPRLLRSSILCRPLSFVSSVVEPRMFRCVEACNGPISLHDGVPVGRHHFRCFVRQVS